MLSLLVKKIQSSIKVNGATVIYGGLLIKFPRNVGVGFLSNIFWKKEDGFEPFVFRAVSRLAPHIQIFLDVGSHFGWYSVIVQKINSKCRTFCYEPIPELSLHNQKFHHENHVFNQQILGYGLSDSSRRAVIHLPSHEPATEVRSASLEANFFFNKKFRNRVVDIECSTLDEQWTSFKTEWVGFILIKIDVEGHEYAVLHGGRRFLTACRPWLVVEIDTSGQNLQALSRLIADLSYDIFAITREGLFKIHSAGLLSFKKGHDFLFVPAEKRMDTYLSWDDLGAFFW
jgi:FkbM family methyltransferase